MTDLRKAAETKLFRLLGDENHDIQLRAAIALLQTPVQGETVTWSKIDDPNKWDVDAVNMSQERVDETAKREHEPVAWVIEDGEVDYYVDVVAKIKPGTPLYAASPKREWVGLTVEEARKLYEKHTNREDLIYAIDKFLEEKNT